MRKIWILVVFTVFLSSCGNKKKEVLLEQDVNQEISLEKWPKKKSVNAKSKFLLDAWQEFNAFDASFDALYKVENKEDLLLAIEDLIEKNKLLEESSYPLEFNLPEIKGRLKVVKTFMLKVKGDIEYSEDTQASVIATIKAYNDLRNQFDVIRNNTLDKTLILEEQ